MAGIGYELYAAAFGQPNLASPALIDSLLRQAAAEVEGHHFMPRFLAGEWRDVVDAWQLKRGKNYRDVARLGRKTRIGGKQREILWAIFERVRAGLAERRAVTWPDLFGRVTEHIAAGGKSPFDFAVVDEAQDVGVAELRFLAALGGNRPDGLFFAGDLGQRIFQQPFSWRSLGVDVRGRSDTLRINYRTSHQIRAQADRLLPLESPMSTATRRTGGAQSRCSTGRPRRSGSSPTRQRRPKRWAVDCRPDRRGRRAARDRGFRARSGAAPPRADSGKTGRRAGRRAEREGRDDTRTRLDRHDASGKGPRVPRRRGHGLRRRR